MIERQRDVKKNWPLQLSPKNTTFTAKCMIKISDWFCKKSSSPFFTYTTFRFNLQNTFINDQPHHFMLSFNNFRIHSTCLTTVFKYTGVGLELELHTNKTTINHVTVEPIKPQRASPSSSPAKE
jgi:hypothetical protein